MPPPQKKKKQKTHTHTYIYILSKGKGYPGALHQNKLNPWPFGYSDTMGFFFAPE